MASIKNKLTNIPTYIDNVKCQHCILISQDMDLIQLTNFSRLPNKRPYTTVEKGQCTNGLSVFDSSNKFVRTFNCVLGLRGEPFESMHNSRNVGVLLYQTTKFIRNFMDRNHLEHVNLLVNSMNQPFLHGKKEHVHALVTVPDEKYDNLFNSPELPALTNHQLLSMSKSAQKHRQVFVSVAPYDSDIKIYLTERDTELLIKCSNNNEFNRLMSEFLYKYKHIHFDMDLLTFFIFVRYIRNEDGIISLTGIISVPENTRQDSSPFSW